MRAIDAVRRSLALSSPVCSPPSLVRAQDGVHQEPPRAPVQKPEWKADDFAQETREQKYEDCLAQTDAALETLNAALLKLEPLICCKDYCTEGGFSYDDIDLWSRLRSMTIVKGVQIPPGVRAYLDNLSELGDVPLYDCMAI